MDEQVVSESAGEEDDAVFKGWRRHRHTDRDLLQKNSTTKAKKQITHREVAAASTNGFSVRMDNEALVKFLNPKDPDHDERIIPKSCIQDSGQRRTQRSFKFDT